MMTGTKIATAMIHALDLEPLVGGGSFVDRFSSPGRKRTQENGGGHSVRRQ